MNAIEVGVGKRDQPMVRIVGDRQNLSLMLSSGCDRPVVGFHMQWTAALVYYARSGSVSRRKTHNGGIIARSKDKIEAAGAWTLIPFPPSSASADRH